MNQNQFVSFSLSLGLILFIGSNFFEVACKKSLPSEMRRENFVEEFANLRFSDDASALFNIATLTKDTFHMRKLSLFAVFAEPVERVAGLSAQDATLKVLIELASSQMVRARTGNEREYFNKLHSEHIAKPCKQKVLPIYHKYTELIESQMRGDETDATLPETQLKRLAQYCLAANKLTEMDQYILYKKFSKAIQKLA